jgi:hypothetical protein
MVENPHYISRTECHLQGKLARGDRVIQHDVSFLGREWKFLVVSAGKHPQTGTPRPHGWCLELILS